MNGAYYLNILDNFMLPIVSQGDIYEELPIMEAETPPHFVLPVCVCLDNHCPI
jgi:hypothetical protein